MKYNYECCVCILRITTALLHRSCDFYCFPLFSRPSVSFGAINVTVTSRTPPPTPPLPANTHSAIDRRSMFRNLFVHYLMNRSFMASLASLDAEFKYIIIFWIWVKLTLLNWIKNNSSPNLHNKYERKILFHRLPLNIRPFYPRGIKIMLKPSASLGFYMILKPLGRNGSLWKSLRS